MVSDWVIETEDLAVGYDDKLVLDGITVRIPRKKITCIIGGSGCGKSTLLRAFVGLAEPRRGSVRILDEDLLSLSEEARAELFERVGLMFQEGGLLNSLTVADNLMVPVKAHTRLPDDVVEDLVRLKLGLVNLEDAADKLPGELSGGMKKRAGLARALMLDPEVLFCDEPSAGLDPTTQADLDRLLCQMRDQLGLTLVVVTHEVESIKTIADYVILLEDGKVGFDGSLDDALESDNETLVGFFGRKPDEQKDRPSLEELMFFDGAPIGAAA